MAGTPPTLSTNGRYVEALRSTALSLAKPYTAS